MSAPQETQGLTIAIVIDRDDKDGLGRVRLKLPAYGNRETDWARVAVPYGGAAGKGHGFYSIPETDDEVLVMFTHTDRLTPIVIGCLYSTKQKPPSNKPDEHILKSRNGHTITISDEDGSERIEIKTSSGQKVTLDEGAGTVTVKAKQKVVVDAPAIELGSGGLEPAILGKAFMLEFAKHTHVAAVPGGLTGPVSPPVLPTSVLSTITTLKG